MRLVLTCRRTEQPPWLGLARWDAVADEKWREDVDLEDGATALEIRTYGEDEEIIAEGEHSSHFFL